MEESRRLAIKRVEFGMRWDSREETRALEDHYRECRHIIRTFNVEEEIADAIVDVCHWDLEG